LGGKTIMLYKMLSRRFRAVFADWYFAYNRSVWTDDPAYKVVQLRNKIVELIEDRISEVTGATTPEEIYLLAPGDDRYTLTRVCGKKIIEGTYFERGFPRGQENQVHPLLITPHMLEIHGNPYKITKKESPQLSQITLKVERVNRPRDLISFPG
jgi:hypothetical protein